MNDHASGKEILGVGWNFPIRVDRRLDSEFAAPYRGSGGIALSRHEEDIEQAISIVLSTAKGERRMRPTFGCDIHTLVYSPANSSTFSLMRVYVEEALRMWEPRIDVKDVAITSDNIDGRVDITVSYEVRTTKDARTLVYPFYTLGED
jgi:phage baseplate assembly protein W